MVLARLPVSYAVWKRLSLFEHGAMDRPEAAIDTFTGHARTAGVLVDGTLRAPMQVALPGSGFTFVELGPGDSVAAAMVGRALGATRSWLVDAGAFATTSAQAYERLADALRARCDGLVDRLAFTAMLEPEATAEVVRDLKAAR